MICLELIRVGVTVPCGHRYCYDCYCDFRGRDVLQACPVCRAALPSFCLDASILQQLGDDLFCSVSPPKFVVDHETMEAAEALWTEAAARGWYNSMIALAQMYQNGWGRTPDRPRAFELYMKCSNYERLGVGWGSANQHITRFFPHALLCSIRRICAQRVLMDAMHRTQKQWSGTTRGSKRNKILLRDYGWPSVIWKDEV